MEFHQVTIDHPSDLLSTEWLPNKRKNGQSNQNNTL